MGNYKKKEIQMKNGELNFNDDDDNGDDIENNIGMENVYSNNNQNDIIGEIQLENTQVDYIGDDEHMSLFDENSENNMDMFQDQTSITQEFVIANNNANDFIPPITAEDDNTSVVSSISASSTKKKRGRPKKNKN